MRQVRRRDTPKEVALRAVLHRAGLRYRIDRAPLKGLRRKADLVFQASRVAIFVDGCFWHLCPTHGEIPERNREWWMRKLMRNRERDRETDRILAEEGWISLRIWEHDEPTRAAVAIERLVRARQRTSIRKTHKGD